MHFKKNIVCYIAKCLSYSNRQLFKQTYVSVNGACLLSDVESTYINKIQQDATVCRYLFTAKLFYMFRTSIIPIIRSTSNCNCSFLYRS